MPRTMSEAEVNAFKQRLVEAAEQLIRLDGSAQFSMRELADAVGCSPMLPYRYFKDRDEIIASVRANGFAKFADALEAPMHNPGDPARRSHQVGEAYVAFAFANPDLYRLMFDAARAEPGRYPQLDAASARARKTMTSHVKALVKNGLLHGEPSVIGHVFWASLHGLIMLELAGQLDPKPGFHRLLQAMNSALVMGMRQPIK